MHQSLCVPALAGMELVMASAKSCLARKLERGEFF